MQLYFSDNEIGVEYEIRFEDIHTAAYDFCLNAQKQGQLTSRYQLIK